MNMTLGDAKEVARFIREELAEMKVPAVVSVHEYHVPSSPDTWVNDLEDAPPRQRLLRSGVIDIRINIGFRQAGEWPSLRRWLEDAPFGKTALEEEG